MSDREQPEQIRTIPDGGLKDAMPSWLKRPPAWRELPTAEQRRERALPEPDTSEIDPRALVNVSDLPPWLQAIAARGEIPAPAPDGAVNHAVEVVQAVTHPIVADTESVALDPEADDSLTDSSPAPMTTSHSAPSTIPTSGGESPLPHLPLWASILIVMLMIALAFTLVTLL